MRNKHVAVFITDVHGNTRALRAAMDKACSEGAKSLILGGDICPKSPLVKLKDGALLDPDSLQLGDIYERTRSKNGMLDPIDKIVLPRAVLRDGSLIVEFPSAKISHAALEWHLKMLARAERGVLFLPELDPASETDKKNLRDFILPEIRKGAARWVYRSIGDNYAIGRLIGSKEKTGGGLNFEIFETILAKEILGGGLKKVLSMKLGGWFHDISECSRDCNRLGKAQVKWVKETLLPLLKEFSEGSGIKVYLMPGNDDAAPVLNTLEKGQTKTLRQIHSKAEPLGDGFFIAGCSYVPWLSDSISMRDWIMDEGAIASILDSLTEGIPPSKLVLSAHPPPCGVPFSRFFIDSEEHDGGSLAVRSFIERTGPLLTLHGHIHEAPSLSGVWKESLAEGSLSINPGAMHHTGPELAVFDLFDIGGISRVKLPLKGEEPER